MSMLLHGYDAPKIHEPNVVRYLAGQARIFFSTYLISQLWILLDREQRMVWVYHVTASSAIAKRA